MSPFEEVGDGKLVSYYQFIFILVFIFLGLVGISYGCFFLFFGGLLSLGLWFDSVRVYGHFCGLYVGLTRFERGFIWISTRVMVSG